VKPVIARSTCDEAIQSEPGGAADPVRQGLDQKNRKARQFVQHELIFLAVDHGQLRVFGHQRGCRPRQRVDQRHHAERLLRTEALDHPLAVHHVDAAGEDHIHGGAGLAQFKHRGAGLDVDDRTSLARENAKIQLPALHVMLSAPPRRDPPSVA
jgi:hypothetical protein